MRNALTELRDVSLHGQVSWQVQHLVHLNMQSSCRCVKAEVQMRRAGAGNLWTSDVFMFVRSCVQSVHSHRCVHIDWFVIGCLYVCSHVCAGLSAEVGLFTIVPST